MPGKQIRVLVVDDESAVRELVEALLKHLGHLVETAANAAEALCKVEQVEFDLVLTDFLMPGMTGDHLAREIKKRRPLVPIVLVTGHQPNTIVPEVSRVLAKPFSLGQLREAIATLT